MNKESRQTFVFWLSAMTACLALLSVIGISAAEMYIRWKINQDFSFLGGWELEAITLLGGGLLAVLLLRRD